MKLKTIFSLLLVMFVGSVHSTKTYADTPPTISPNAIFFTTEGEEEGDSFSGSAPLRAQFFANASGAEGWKEYYEWRFTYEGQGQPYLVRYEQDTEFNFTKAGTTRVVLFATFTRNNEKVEYTEEYWQDATPITVSISESKLEMPNAFSPNGDGINDVYKAKQGWQSIVEFKGIILNRWGQKLFEWTNPAEGWDGTFNGKDVAQGVYFARVTALGADGRKYDIKKDVNLLRGYTEGDKY